MKVKFSTRILTIEAIHFAVNTDCNNAFPELIITFDNKNCPEHFSLSDTEEVSSEFEKVKNFFALFNASQSSELIGKKIIELNCCITTSSSIETDTIGYGNDANEFVSLNRYFDGIFQREELESKLTQIITQKRNKND